MAVSEIARCPSLDLSLASNSPDICRICHCEGSSDLPLLSPCYCSGSLKYVHQACLQQWIKSSNNTNCELCKFQFIMQTRFKRLSEWEYLEMTGMERKKLCFAMLFHLVAMTCVCWSLYVLIDRTLDEIKKGNLEWPFWTKLIVVGIGFMGGVIFMYIQCKAYVILCGRWKSYNRVIFIQNAPPKHPVKRIEPSNVDRIEKECLTAGQNAARTSCNNVDTKDGCIDIKGIRNLRIYLDDDHRITVHKNEPCCSGNTQSRYEDVDRETPSWKIQIDENSSLYNWDNNYNWDSTDSNSHESQSMDQDCALELPSDKVVKVQIQHKDVVIEFENNRRNDQEYTDDDGDTCKKMTLVNTNIKSLLFEPKITIEEWSSKDDLLSDTVETSRNIRASTLKENSLDTRSVQSV